MAITPPITGADGKLDVAATGRTRLAESFDTFLNLLTTQLKNQDPLAPLDSNQFTQQIVQMTGVEQQLLTNELLTKMVGNTANGVSTAVSLIGKEVRAVSATNSIFNGKAEWTYKFDRAAENVKLEIIDSAGRTVHVAAPTDNSAGEHTLTWDGKDLAGSQLPNGGVYTLKVTAADANGAPMAPVIFIRGLVTGVEQRDGQTLIALNGGRVAWDKVTDINLPAPPPAPVTPPPA
jgi:flagellar basal-body rod modification protein FlgD